MEIYLAETQNFMGYTLLGDLGQEYVTNVYPKNNKLDFNAHEKCLEMALFYVLANKPIYTKESPKIFLDKKDINQAYILSFKDNILKNPFFNKYNRDTSQSLLISDLKSYDENNKIRLYDLNSQLGIRERNLILKNNAFKYKEY